jgi:hypothetical protein
VLEAAKKEVEAGHAASVSALVSEAVDEKLRRNELATLLDEGSARSGNLNVARRLRVERARGSP